MTDMHSHKPVSQEIIFFDDFNAPILDRAKWNVVVTGEVFNKEQQAYIDSPDTIYTLPGQVEDADGVLVIQPRWRPNFFTKDGQQFDFVSGRIDTSRKVELTYGNISARIKLPAGLGLWPAFWMKGQGKWPECGEIDIMESVGEPEWTNAAIHGTGYSGDHALVNNYYFSKDNDATAWHIYSVDVNPTDELVFKVDEVVIYRVTRSMVEYFGPWAFRSPKYVILNVALGGIYPFKIYGVRQPYYGLPAHTVQAIQNNHVRMLVDWVKVTHLAENNR
jgi:beta-glucanase (GH16 family)